VHEWPEDRVESVITPRAIDWVRWRAARLSAKAIATAPAGTSKLKRDMMARKAAKGTLRLVG
jgi:hypothetical protein